MRYFYFLQQFFERLPAPAFIKDTKGRFIWVNEEFLRILNLTEDKVISKFESQLLGIESIEDIDRKVMRMRRNQTHDIVFNGRYYTVHRMPIRLGTGSYGVAGIMYDVTEKVLEQVLYRMQSFVEEKIIEALTESSGDIDNFVISFCKKFHETYPHIAVALLKDNKYVIGEDNPKVLEKAMNAKEVKTFVVEKKTYQVIPIENLKFVVHIPEQYLAVAKALANYLKSHVLAALKILESQRTYAEFAARLDAILKLINLLEECSTLEEYLKKMLYELVRIIPETQKASVWLLDGDEYKLVAAYNYPELTAFKMKAEEDNYGPVIGENRVVELENAYLINRQNKYRELWEKVGVTEPNFIPLVGSVRLGEKRLVIVSLDNFEGKHFSETSKKLLKVLVDLLSAFLNKRGL